MEIRQDRNAKIIRAICYVFLGLVGLGAVVYLVGGLFYYDEGPDRTQLIKTWKFIFLGPILIAISIPIKKLYDKFKPTEAENLKVKVFFKLLPFLGLVWFVSFYSIYIQQGVITIERFLENGHKVFLPAFILAYLIIYFIEKRKANRGNDKWR